MNDMLHLALLERQQIGADAGMIFPSYICAKCALLREGVMCHSNPIIIACRHSNVFRFVRRESFGCIHI